MNDTEASQPEGDQMISLLRLFIEKFAGASFGVAAVVILYVLVAKPEMERLNITFEEERLLIADLRTVVNDRKDVAQTFFAAASMQKGASDTVLKSAELLDAISRRLETLTDKLIDKQISTRPFTRPPSNSAVHSVEDLR